MLRGTTLLGAFAPTLRRAHTQLLYNGSTRPSLLVAFRLEAQGGVIFRFAYRLTPTDGSL